MNLHARSVVLLATCLLWWSFGCDLNGFSGEADVPVAGTNPDVKTGVDVCGAGNTCPDGEFIGSGCQGPLLFTDPELETAIREAVDMGDGTLMPLDVADLRVLDLSGRAVESLEGVECLTQLEELLIDETQIADLAPIESMSWLVALSLNQTGVESLSPLTGLVNLEVLAANQADINDLSPLADLLQLYGLFLDDNSISDLAPLANLGNLKFLMLNGNKVAKLDGLDDLGLLEQLELEANLVEDLSCLEGLVSLSYVRLTANQVTDLKPLVDNPDFGDAGTLFIKDNPLNCGEQLPNIKLLEARGVTVFTDCE